MKAKAKVDAAKILAAVQASPGHRVKVAVADIDGVLRGKYMNKDKFLSAAQSGFGFCNVVFGWDVGDQAYDNGRYTGWHTGFPDAQAQVDLNTMRRIPWDDETPMFLGDFVDAKGGPLAVCPRQLLKKVLGRAAKSGYQVLTGMEFEWFNFSETPQSLAAKHYTAPQTISPQMFGYSLIRMNQSQPFFRALMEELPAFNIPIESLHTETGPGVVEAALLYSEALEAADRAILFKTAVKEIAFRFGIMPSFMAKWSADYPGCSGHIHQSVTDGKKNLFYDEKDKFRMSKFFKSYLAGQLHCLPEIMPFVAPTINSYKRLVDGYWAPVKPTWSVDNRTASLRVIPGSSKSTRLETRSPGADVNPYLAMAACIAAGMYGVENNMKLAEPPTQGDNTNTDHIARLPRNLKDATEKLKHSKLTRALFGGEFVDHFVATREWEWRQFQDAVTDWEIRRYFEII